MDRLAIMATNSPNQATSDLRSNIDQLNNLAIEVGIEVRIMI
jgi:hypothetical protein